MATASYNDLNVASLWKQVIELTCVELKLESKDPRLARVWHSIEFILIQPYMLEVGYLWPRWWVSLAEL
jgi:hypothetical protein